MDFLPNNFSHLFVSVALNDYRAIFDDFTQFVCGDYCLPMYFSLSLSRSSAHVIEDQRLYRPLPTFSVKKHNSRAALSQGGEETI